MEAQVSVTSTRERTSSHVGKLPSKGDRINAKDNAAIPDNQTKLKTKNEAEIRPEKRLLSDHVSMERSQKRKVSYVSSALCMDGMRLRIGEKQAALNCSLDPYLLHTVRSHANAVEVAFTSMS